jgi:hypothetical protein
MRHDIPVLGRKFEWNCVGSSDSETARRDDIPGSFRRSLGKNEIHQFH